MSNEDKLNRWAATFVSLPKEAVQASVDYAEFTTGLSSAVLVLNAMVKAGYDVSLDVSGDQADVEFLDTGSEGRAAGSADELAMLIVTAAYQAEHGGEKTEDEDEDEEDADA